MHQGFRGTRIGLKTLSLTDTVLEYEIAFVSEDGVIHGVMKHSLLTGGDTNIDQKLGELSQLLLDRAAQTHFTSAASSDSSGLPTTGGKKNVGLAEVLGAAGTTSDEPGVPEDAGRG